MDPFSLSVGTLTILDECLKYGTILVKLYNDYRSSETLFSETLLKLETLWYKSETRMRFLQRVWSSLDSNFQRNQHLLLNILEIKLQDAVRLLNGVIGIESEPKGLDRILLKEGSLKKGRYVLTEKKTLDDILSEFIQWHSLFDPSRSPGEEIGRNIGSQDKNGAIKMLADLRKSVRDLNPEGNIATRSFSSKDFLGPRTLIAGSPATHTQFEGNFRYAIVDTMVVNCDMDAAATTSSVVALSRALSRMASFTFGLLRCCGVINEDKYEFVFEIPQELRGPQSLRNLLTKIRPTLNVKLEIAKQLANSVFYLHTAGFVHKNIRPETVLLFDREEAKASFLVGFENFRPAKFLSFNIGDSVPERELYRHPSRQGNDPERRYITQHEIYSLGVCLLEIRLWRSFVNIEDGKTVIEADLETTMKDFNAKAFARKKQFLQITHEQLSQHTGERFKNVVEKCLSCLDEDTTWFQVDDKGQPEIDLGVEFIENVLLQLQEIVI